MTSEAWTLEPSAEAAILLPWLLDPSVSREAKDRVIGYLASLLRDPVRPLLEDDDTGIYSVEAVPGTNVGLVWILNTDTRQVVLAHVE